MNENISLELLTVIDTIIKNGMLIKFSGYTSLLLAKNFLVDLRGSYGIFVFFFYSYTDLSEIFTAYVKLIMKHIFFV